MSQAQKSLGSKNAEASKAAAGGVHKAKAGDKALVANIAEAKTCPEPLATAGPPTQPANLKLSLKKGGAPGPAAATPSHGSARTASPAGPLSQAELRAETANRERLESAKAGHSARAQGESGAAQRDHPAKKAGAGLDEAVADRARASDTQRRTKEGREGSVEASLAAGAAQVKLPSLAPQASKHKAVSSELEAEPSTEKKVERRGSAPKLSVLDLRRASAATSEVSAGPKAEANDPRTETKAREGGREIFKEFSLDARQPDGTPSPAAAAKGAAGSGQDFQAAMAERMRDAWNGEIVQSAHIVLRDGDSGTIRLRLKPESLGNVKIELNLSENNIRGRIVVESDEAKSAFERNMNQLADAFKQGGFDSARLEVSVGGGSGFASQGGGAGTDSSTGPFFSERLRRAVDSTAEPAASSSAYARRGGSVDILA